MTTPEAAAVLGVQPKTVTRYILRGLIAATKRGRDYWIEPSALTQFQQMRRGVGYPAGRPRK